MDEESKLVHYRFAILDVDGVQYHPLEMLRLENIRSVRSPLRVDLFSLRHGEWPQTLSDKLLPIVSGSSHRTVKLFIQVSASMANDSVSDKWLSTTEYV